MERYVLARITTMAGIDIGLFDYDRHNAIYFFILNADEHIYLRYGGRDAEDAMTYMNLQSIELALKAGLDRHELYKQDKQGKLAKQPRPAPFYPEQIALLKKHEIDRGRCVECHLIGDYLAQEADLAGKLDRPRMLYPSPDLKKIGIHLDVPKGLVIEKVEGAAEKAGMRAGDTVTAIDGADVLTFGDLQYRFGKTKRNARRIELTVNRAGKSRVLIVALPVEWWATDTSYRFWSVEPMVYFTARPLTVEQKRKLNLPVKGLASEVIEVDPLAESLKLHTLKPGDIITSVEGIRESRLTQNVELYIKLTMKAGDSATLDLLRNGESMRMKVTSYRQFFRKQRTE
jgi:serine protease Do